MYYLFHIDDNGGLNVIDFKDKETLLDDIYYDWVEPHKEECKPIFVDDFESLKNNNIDDKRIRLLIIKGDIVKPKPIKIVEKWMIEE